MRRPPWILTAATCLLLAGCQEREQALEKHRQATADTAATIFEAATAIENGADPRGPAVAIKLGAAAIIETQGRTYPPAEQFMHDVRNRSKQPLPVPSPARK